MNDRAIPDDPPDPSAIPTDLRDLIPLAEEWGIGDDHDRATKVEQASDDALQELIEAVAGAPDALWDWLAGPESSSATPSREDVAMTDLTQAADLARVILRQRQSSR